MSCGRAACTSGADSALGLTLIDRNVPAGRPSRASAARSAAASSRGPSPTRVACENQESGARPGGSGKRDSAS